MGPTGEATEVPGSRKLRVLVLDDDDTRHNLFREWLEEHEAHHVHTAAQAMKALHNEPRFDIVCLDHDLGILSSAPGSDVSGAVVAQFIAHGLDEEKQPRRVIVHSWNSVGVRAICGALAFMATAVVVVPFGPSVRKWLR